MSLLKLKFSSFFSYMPRSGTVGSYGNSVFSLAKTNFIQKLLQYGKRDLSMEVWSIPRLPWWLSGEKSTCQ